MLKRDKSLFLKIAFAFMLITGFASCQLFEADVADFMEKYTETAGIEEHEINVETYNDALSHLCISSESDTQLSFFMRNPKSFNLIPSVHFPELDETISTEFVTIQQTDKQTINLSLPTSFLVPADMGNNITAEVSLYEPMSGREFDHYKVDLHCNTIPPQIINPVIMNSKQSGDSEDVAQYFIIAFDMPNEDAVAVRHTDISQIVINGVGYPVTIPEPFQDSEGVKTLIYGSTVFSDTKFTKALSTGLVTGSCPYTVIGDKSFTPNRNSYYFATGESFVAGNKEYTIQLKDDAGLTSTVTASTTIRKLNKPIIHSIDTIANITTELSGTGAIGVPYNEESGVGVISITPPATDHKGDPVSGVTVYYKIYEATGLGRLYTSGSTATTRRIELPQNTYRVEAYAVRTNYEQSATENLKIRLVNNVIYIEAVTDLSAPNAANLTTCDGSVNAPFPTIQDAINDINNLPATDRKDNYTFYIKGDFTGNVYSKAYPTQARDYSGAVLNTLNTQEITIAKCPGASEAKLKTIQVDSSPTTLTKVKIGDITLSHNDTHLNFTNPSVCYEVDGTVIQGTDSTNAVGINLYMAANEQNVIKNCTISGCLNGILATSSSKITLQNGSITSCDTGIETGNNSRVNLYGGSITGNKIGINVYSSATLNVQGSPVVNNNLSTDTPPVKQNIMLPASKLINVTGALASSCRLSVTTTGAPSAVGDPVQEFTSGFRDNNSTALPSSFFYSDSGLSVVLSEDGQAGLVVAGASGPDIYSAADYNFSFAVSDDSTVSSTTAIYPEAEKTLKITPSITRAGVQLYYNYADKKLYTDSSFAASSVVANGNTVTWSAAIYNNGRKVADVASENITDVSGGVKVKFTAPANIGNYTLKVYASFLDLPHSGSFPLSCYTYATNAAVGIGSFTSGEHNITVTGSVSPADLQLVASALTSHNSDGVKINLDASGTTNANENLDDYAEETYNYGAYFFECTALKSMKLPGWMVGILPFLFSTSGITAVEIPDTIIGIYEAAFQACTGLTEINLPASLTDIHTLAFDGCTALETINFAGTKAEWKQVDKDAGWHTLVPATVVHCSDGDCGLDAGPDYTFYTTPAQLSNGSDGTAGTSGQYIYFGDWPQSRLPANSGILIYDGVSDTNHAVESITRGDYTYYKASDGNYYYQARISGVYTYYKVEPIKWRVLTQSSGGKWLLFAENILESVQYYGGSDTREVNGTEIDTTSYYYSNIRAYLNGIDNQFVTDGGTRNQYYDIDWSNKGFLYTAFTESARNLIVTKNLTTSGELETINDKVILLAEDVLCTSAQNLSASSYFDGETIKRKRTPVDFAYFCGVSEEEPNYWTRVKQSGSVCSIRHDTEGFMIKSTDYMGYGVVPAIYIESIP